MTRNQFLRSIEGILESPLEPGTLTGEELCSDLDGWDSLAVLSYIALVNKEFGITLPAQSIFACKKMNEVIDLVEDQLEP